MMIINTRKDLDAAPDDVREQFINRLASTINKHVWDGSGWVLKQDETSIARFGFTAVDFPDAPVPEVPGYNPDQQERERLAAEVPGERKKREAEGVTINGVRYAGDASNRQALNEAVQFAEQAGATTFDRWKDSDGSYHADHPVADVKKALQSIAARRSALIALESEHVDAVLSGSVASLDELDWTV